MDFLSPRELLRSSEVYLGIFGGSWSFLCQIVFTGVLRGGFFPGMLFFTFFFVYYSMSSVLRSEDLASVG